MKVVASCEKVWRGACGLRTTHYLMGHPIYLFTAQAVKANAQNQNILLRAGKERNSISLVKAIEKETGQTESPMQIGRDVVFGLVSGRVLRLEVCWKASRYRVIAP